MKKILVVCGNGLGSSMIVEMNVKAILKELGKEADVSHTDLATAKSEQADVFLGSEDIVNSLEDGKKNVIKLKNLMDKGELRDAIEQNI
ncbi:MAG: PTS sugar transporter subunit IIB [Bacillota bacterium]|uniref:PTS sugar transporter subunit IIB n=1 Tax=Virgibacillus salarius TaxID=447199 RepID=A0A941IBC4_9BACI|nr:MULTISPECIES: PTS sugar transporter subunit IIB [Bacillaceae]NAZ08970.1 PTS lactose transporter subunit IIB [Agaribacter marinus]MBR7796262.1 PTS sugar transporter subunit IIB [Virgibacillus salarius]MCC2248493.1 PTS sugar transporter subunit IIB [Virgibacillus sp. AGTR]MDY7043072.1 PTS sugar transporter subunit IIB [Virgibacillus sp. M23]QRZ16642.1 PTS sugar transporter subunit IIB [Virgibacillus sp. AGTR]